MVLGTGAGNHGGEAQLSFIIKQEVTRQMRQKLIKSRLTASPLCVLTAQRYFQCIYVPGKNAQYPLRPFTPAMTPTMMSPAIKAMLEQQKAARAAGQ